jgi:hypothetical protein
LRGKRVVVVAIELGVMRGNAMLVIQGIDSQPLKPENPKRA